MKTSSLLILMAFIAMLLSTSVFASNTGYTSLSSVTMSLDSTIIDAVDAIDAHYLYMVGDVANATISVNGTLPTGGKGIVTVKGSDGSLSFVEMTSNTGTLSITLPSIPGEYQYIAKVSISNFDYTSVVKVKVISITMPDEVQLLESETEGIEFPISFEPPLTDVEVSRLTLESEDPTIAEPVEYYLNGNSGGSYFASISGISTLSSRYQFISFAQTKGTTKGKTKPKNGSAGKTTKIFIKYDNKGKMFCRVVVSGNRSVGIYESHPKFGWTTDKPHIQGLTIDGVWWYLNGNFKGFSTTTGKVIASWNTNDPMGGCWDLGYKTYSASDLSNNIGSLDQQHIPSMSAPMTEYKTPDGQKIIVQGDSSRLDYCLTVAEYGGLNKLANSVQLKVNKEYIYKYIGTTSAVEKPTIDSGWYVDAVQGYDDETRTLEYKYGESKKVERTSTITGEASYDSKVNANFKAKLGSEYSYKSTNDDYVEKLVEYKTKIGCCITFWQAFIINTFIFDSIKTDKWGNQTNMGRIHFDKPEYRPAFYRDDKNATYLQTNSSLFINPFTRKANNL